MLLHITFLKKDVLIFQSNSFILLKKKVLLSQLVLKVIELIRWISHCVPSFNDLLALLNAPQKSYKGALINACNFIYLGFFENRKGKVKTVSEFGLKR